MKTIQFRGIRPDDLHGRMALRNPERGFRTEIYVSEIADEIAGTCSCHSKRSTAARRRQSTRTGRCREYRTSFEATA